MVTSDCHEEARRDTPVDSKHLRTETDKPYHFDTAGADMLTDGVDGNVCGALRREVIYAGADGGKCNGPRLMTFCEIEAEPVAGSKKVVFLVATSLPDRANGMKNPLRGKMKSRGRLGVARRATTQLSALRQQLGASGPVNGSVHAAAAEQRTVGCIHDRVNSKRCNVRLNCNQLRHALSTLQTAPICAARFQRL